MKVLAFLFIVLCVLSAQFNLEKPEQVRLVYVGQVGAPIPPHKKRGKLKGWQRGR